MTTISTTNEQSNIATGPGTVVANAESSTIRFRARASERGLPSANTPSPTGQLRQFVDNASNNTRGPIHNIIRQFVSRERTLETAEKAMSLQYSR